MFFLLRAWDLNRRSAERERGKPPRMAAPATEAARRKVQEEPFGEKSHLPDFCKTCNSLWYKKLYGLEKSQKSPCIQNVYETSAKKQWDGMGNILHFIIERYTDKK